MEHKIDTTATTWRLRPFLEEGEPTLLFGPGGSGKSYLAMTMAYLVASGNQHLGLEPAKGGVLYCDYEATLNVAVRDAYRR